MRDISIVEKELIEAKRKLENTDESDLLKMEINKSIVGRLENELELIKRGKRTVKTIEGLPKGKYKKTKKSRISINKFNI